jgi:hypothetical protein
LALRGIARLRKKASELREAMLWLLDHPQVREFRGNVA